MKNTPVTEAHYTLRRHVIFSAPDEGAQLIADSEAKACDQLRADVELWEAKCHELIAPHYIIDPCLRAAKFREALAFHPVIRKPKKEETK